MNTSPNFIEIDTKITFQNLCDIYEKIKKANGKSKSDILRNYFADWRNLKTNPNDAINMYSILRLLVPQYERDRGPYGIKENTFAKIYIRILNLPKNGLDAQKLLNYKAPSSSTAISTDFADVAFWILKSRSKVKNADIFIDKINKHLDQIALSHANNQPRSVDDELTKLVGSMTALQQKWLIRIILKDLKLGMGQMKILSCFHPDAPDLYDSSNNLSKLCIELHDLKIRLNEIEIEMYTPYRPMLSEKLDIAKIKSAMKRDESYYLEAKFDGERFQIHMKNGAFKYFSRNGFDYSQQFGETFDSNGSLTKNLKRLLNDDVHSFIIDGEMMGWHKVKKMFSSKGINFDVKKITEESVFQPCFCAFDILLYNDIILSNKPLKERVGYLDRLFKEEEGIFMHSKREETQDCEKVIQNLNKAIENQEEGIVLKNVMSIYKPNNRKGGWFKIKPEYTEGVMNELDLLIIGGYFVENKRYSEIGSVLLGVADMSKNEKNEPVMFHSIGKVKLGLNKEEIEELCGKLKPYWNKVQKDTNPSSVTWSKDKPDVWIEPEKSIILQIKASELVKSNAFKTEYTVRFPRIVSIRYEKPWYDCLTIKEFEDLTKYSHGVEKLTSRNIGEDDIEHPDNSPRKKMKLLSVAAQFRPTNVEGLLEKSNIFSGKEFCIITGNRELKKSDLELKVVENGGQIVQNPGKNTFCIIAGDKNVRVMNAIKSGEHNVATVDWFLNTLKEEHISSGKLLEWTPRDLIGKSLSVNENFVLKYDKYGDSFTEPTNEELLKYSMSQIENDFEIQHDILPSEIFQMDLEIFNGLNPYSFLRSCNIYVFEKNTERIEIQILKIEIILYGGTYCDSIGPETSHVLVSSIPNDNEICEMKNKINLYECKPNILTIDWVFDCIKKEKIIDTCDYKMNFINL